MSRAFRGRVTGRVQGVGYRYFAEHAARELGVRGWVRNLPDGSVEILASGEPSILDEFLLRLKRGPLSARVEALDVDWLEEVPKSQGFRITD